MKKKVEDPFVEYDPLSTASTMEAYETSNDFIAKSSMVKCSEGQDEIFDNCIKDVKVEDDDETVDVVNGIKTENAES